MNKHFLLLGFFLATVGFVTVDHIIKQPDPTEIFDSVLTALIFTASFALGLRLGDGRGKSHLPGRRGFLHGLGAGVVVQVVIWGVWLSVPHSVRYSFGLWPLLCHLILAVVAGYAVSRWRMSRLSGA